MTRSFIDLGVSEGIVRALGKRGITEPFAVQTKALPDAIAGRDVLVKSKTGSGKTLAFAIPIVQRLGGEATRRPAALVLTPTRELAQQVAAELQGFAGSKGLRVALAYGGTSVAQQGHQARKAHIIVATPGRLEDLVSRGMVSLANISILVLDEADHMLDMGFLPQVDRLVERIPQRRQTMLFSATLDGEVGRIAQRYTRDPVTHELAAAPAAADVEHRFVPVPHSGKTEALAALLRSTESTLVFVRTKHGADRLVKQLARHGIEAAAMHGDKSQNARDRALAAFAHGRVAALVATDVAARGIDVSNIARVVNYDAPGDDKAFVHRVGRTGRAGARGVSVTFVSPDQQDEVGKMAGRLQLAAEFAGAGFVRESRPHRSAPPKRRAGAPRNAARHRGGARPARSQRRRSA